MEKKACHPQVISHCNSFTWTNLKFPLEKVLNVYGMHIEGFYLYNPIEKSESSFYATVIYHLGRHDLRIGSRNVNARVKASAVMSLNNVSSVDFISTNPAIVRTLWTRKPVFRPTERVLVLVQ
jgi:hypothetical protein